MSEQFDHNILKALIQLDEIVELTGSSENYYTKKELKMRALRAIHLIYRAHPEFKPKESVIFTEVVE